MAQMISKGKIIKLFNDVLVRLCTECEEGYNLENLLHLTLERRKISGGGQNPSEDDRTKVDTREQVLGEGSEKRRKMYQAKNKSMGKARVEEMGNVRECLVVWQAQITEQEVERTITEAGE